MYKIKAREELQKIAGHAPPLTRRRGAGGGGGGGACCVLLTDSRTASTRVGPKETGGSRVKKRRSEHEETGRRDNGERADEEGA